MKRPEPAGAAAPESSVRGLRARRAATLCSAVVDEVRSDHVTLLASGVAFWFLLALVPTVVATVSIAAVVVDPDRVAVFVSDVFSAAPPEVADLVTASVRSSSGSPARTTFSVVASVVVSVWVSSAAASRMIEALEVAYEASETRSMVTRRALALLLCAGGVAVTAVLAALVVWVPSQLRGADIPAWAASLLELLRFVPAAAVLVAASAVLYRLAPDRRGVPASHRFRRILPGAFAAAALWLPASALLGVYSTRVADVGSTYGPLAAVVVVMLWLFSSAFAVLVGAELNSVLERGADLMVRRPALGVPSRSAVSTVTRWVLDRVAQRPR